MSSVKANGPLINPGLCRCCRSIKKCRLMNIEYEWMGQKEIYSEMILDCFGLLLSSTENDNKIGVCATCVLRIRDASAFKKQVLQCEEIFLRKLHEVKEEDQQIDSDADTKSKTQEMTSDTESICDDNDEDPNYEPPDKKTITNSKKKSEPRLIVRKKLTPKFSVKTNQNKLIRINVDKQLMHHKMEFTRRKLNKALKTSVMSTMKQVSSKSNAMKTYQNRDLAIQNVITLVQCSYVCPFKCRRNCFYCYYCRIIFTHPDELRDHNLTHDPNEFQQMTGYRYVTKVDVYRIDCRLCPEKIDNIDQFKEHITTVHNRQFHSVSTENFVQFRLTFQNPTCLVCNKSFLSFYYLYTHTVRHVSNFTCEVCGKCFLDENVLSLHLKTHKDSYTCEICGKTFKQKYYKTLHISTVHKKEPTIYCTKCDEKFHSYCTREAHLRDKHGEPKKQFPCNMCDKLYHRRKTLMEHIRRSHMNVRNHQCEYCDQKFFTPGRLKEHITATHKGERNYHCEHCDKTYPRLKSLQVHIRTHTNDRRYKCNVCGQAFIQNTSLKSHIKSHHPELLWTVEANV